MINIKLNKHLKIHKTFINQNTNLESTSLDQTLHPNYQQVKQIKKHENIQVSNT
jgi:hypothetical protein